MSTVYTKSDSVRLSRKGAKDGAGIRGAFVKSIVDDAMDEARAASDALAAAEGRKRRKRKEAPAAAEKPVDKKQKAGKGEEEESKKKDGRSDQEVLQEFEDFVTSIGVKVADVGKFLTFLLKCGADAVPFDEQGWSVIKRSYA